MSDILKSRPRRVGLGIKPNKDVTGTVDNSKVIVVGDGHDIGVEQSQTHNSMVDELARDLEYEVESIDGTTKADINLSTQLAKDGDEINRIQIIRKDRTSEVIDGVDYDKLHKIIKESSNLDHVIIEHIKVDDATRVKLNFSGRNESEDNDKRVTDTGSYSSLKDDSEIVAPKININARGLKRSRINKSHIQSNSFVSLENNDGSIPIVENDKIEEELHESINNSHQKKIFSPNTNINNKFTDSKQNIVTTVKPQKDKIKDVDFDRHVVSKKKKRISGKYYYKAKSHMDLYKVGTSYFDDFKKGKKVFSFSSVSIKPDQQKMVFGVGAFFNYHSDKKVTIVTERFEDSIYQKFIKDPDREMKDSYIGDVLYEFYSQNGIDIIEMSEIRRLFDVFGDSDFDQFLREFVSNSDVVLWDLPSMKKMQAERHIYFPITRYFDNVSFVFKFYKNSLDDMSLLHDYFEKYHVKIKGVVVSEGEKNEKRSKK